MSAVVQCFPSTALEENSSVGAAMHALSSSVIPVPKVLRARDASVMTQGLKSSFKSHLQVMHQGPCSLPLPVQYKSPGTCNSKLIHPQQGFVLGSAFYPDAEGFAGAFTEEILPSRCLAELGCCTEQRKRLVCCCCCACGRWLMDACIPLSCLCLPAQPVLPTSWKQSSVTPAQTAGLMPGSGQGSPGVGTERWGEHCSQTGQGAAKKRILFPWDMSGAKNNDSTSGKVFSPAVAIPGCPALARRQAVPCWASGRDHDQAGSPGLKGF